MCNINTIERNYFKGWNCNLGVDLIKIFHDGRITGNCQQLIYGLDNYENIYNNNFVNTFNPPVIPIMCSKTVCGCNGEIILKKWLDRARF